jgi:DNA-binding transcriptional ArsR family regulator
MKRKRPALGGSGASRHLAALASPLRIELIGALRTHGPASIRELATQLDRAPDGLYHHVRTLLKAGIIVERAQRKVGRRTEALYELAASRIAGRLDPKSPQSKTAAVRAGAAAIRLAVREFKTAIESDAVTFSNGVANTRASRQTTWLTDPGILKLHRLLGQIERLLLKENKHKRGRLHSLTVVLAPCVKRRTFKHGSS